MALPSLTWLSQVGSAAFRLIPGIGTVVALVAFIYDVGERMVCGGLNYALASITSLDTSAFSNATFATITGIGYGNALFPLTEAIQIWVALATACGVILVIRWIKSFVPTISN